MPQNDPPIDGIDDLRELNQLFLLFLKHQDDINLAGFGFPAAVARALRAAPIEQLDALADFPRALFRLDLDAVGGSSGMQTPAVIHDPGRHALNVTLLVSAWNLSRKSGYAARLFLRLSDPEIRVLRTTALRDLAALALQADLVSCAFLDSIWMWQELLTETCPDGRRRLLLIGLQPQTQIYRPIGPSLGVTAPM